MPLIDRRAALRELAAAAIALRAATGSVAPASAQAPKIPAEPEIEMLIKQSLLTLNDANLTGNYAVMHARMAPKLRTQFTAEQVKAAFRDFADQRVDFALIVTQKPILSEPARFDAEGALVLVGRFDTRPSRVVFSLRMLTLDGRWSILGINVNTTAADAGKAAGKM